MIKIHTIDLNFQNENHSIAAFLIESTAGPILIETGPESTYGQLVEAIKIIGFRVEDIKHVFVTHIHFDHAGAAWRFAETGASIYVNAAGYPHLANPEKLWNSAKQIYGEKMETLWGTMKPISEEKLISANDEDLFSIGTVDIKVLYTPGHAVHHNAYLVDQLIFTGDVAGVKILNGPVVPPCPPPDINIELWKTSLSKLKNLNGKGLYLTHYGYHDNPNQLLSDLEDMLDSWAQKIYPFYLKNIPESDIISEFMSFVHQQLKNKGVSEELIKIYEYANPSWMSVAGLMRYWRLKDEGRI